jgi:hypothetical protein
MAADSDHHHSVRRIVLPSGRSIEVVRFHDTDEPMRRGLHVCHRCESDLVQPVAWSEAEQDRWELTLECPNCFWSAEGVFNRDQIDQFEERLDDGLSAMLADLKRLTHANMAEDLERFVAALEADYILPEDF